MADTARPGLAPLGAVSQGGLKPIGPQSGVQPVTPPAAERPAGVDVSVAANDPVESYLAEHPETPSAVETPAPAEVPPSEAPATPAPETPPTEDAPQAVAAPTAEAAKGDTLPVTPPTPEAAKPATEVPAAATQPAPEAAQQPKPTYAGDEKIVLAANPDGSTVEWTRAQITAALHERAQHAPLVAEAAAFKEIFGTDAATAKTEWQPILERLRSEPHTVALFEAALADPDKAAYLQRSLAHYDAEVAAGNYQPQPHVAPQTDPLVMREVQEMRAWRQQQERRAADERVQREYNAAVVRYPFLAGNKPLLDGIMLAAAALNRQNSAWGLPEAIETNRASLDAMLIAQSPPQPAAPQAPAAPVPALLGSPGASPGATRGVDDGRPRKFPSADEATDAWLRDHPA